jgi:predicted secreted protein with PEFG-CTERM motif
LFSSAVGDTIYVMGGGFVPGASYSNLNHAYQNNAIPEFGTIAATILAVAIISIIAVSARSRLSIMPRL